MEDPEIVVELLAQNEEAISRLYEAYSQRFPDYQDFWSGLAGDEENHAIWLRSLALRAGAGWLEFKEGRFNTAAIQTFSQYLDEELAKAQEPDLPLINALTTAKYIEEALIERNYFEVFEGDSFEAKRTLARLADETERHVGIVEKAWEKEKQGN